MSVTITLTDSEASKLFNLLEENKTAYPDLHETVYQAMTKELMNRINHNLHPKE
jgi:hypothetical protein